LKHTASILDIEIRSTALWPHFTRCTDHDHPWQPELRPRIGTNMTFTILSPISLQHFIRLCSLGIAITSGTTHLKLLSIGRMLHQCGQPQVTSFRPFFLEPIRLLLAPSYGQNGTQLVLEFYIRSTLASGHSCALPSQGQQLTGRPTYLSRSWRTLLQPLLLDSSLPQHQS
jgi:hypothetical protein